MTCLATRSDLGFPGIQELSPDELDYVAGGPLPLIPIIVGIGGAIIGAIAGVVTARSTDDCTTTTSYVYDSQGRVVRKVETTTCN